MRRRGRLAEGARVAHVADRADGQVLAHGRVARVDVPARLVGDRLVQRAGLVLVLEARRVLGHRVGELVRRDVVDREAVAVDHLEPVPERVLVADAVVDEAHELRAGAVVGVTAEVRGVVVVGRTGPVVGAVDVVLPVAGSPSPRAKVPVVVLPLAL